MEIYQNRAWRFQVMYVKIEYHFVFMVIYYCTNVKKKAGSNFSEPAFHFYFAVITIRVLPVPVGHLLLLSRVHHALY